MEKPRPERGFFIVRMGLAKRTTRYQCAMPDRGYDRRSNSGVLAQYQPTETSLEFNIQLLNDPS